MIPSHVEPTLAGALALATAVHEDQVDKAGVPYIRHIHHVMSQVSTDHEKMVAALHDVVEDSSMDLSHLAALGFPAQVVAAVDALTKRNDEGYASYITRVKQHPLAVAVKLADLGHNMDLSRLPNPTEKDHARLEKYRWAYDELTRQRRFQILYVDMDNVLVDFSTGIARLPQDALEQYEGRLDEIPDIFARMHPMPGAIEAFTALAPHYDTFILSTAPWENPSAWSDKLLWVKEHLGAVAHKRLILSHHKDLLNGDFLIDDRTKNGVDRFQGEHIHFGTDRFPDWPSVLEYLLPNKKEAAGRPER